MENDTIVTTYAIIGGGIAGVTCAETLHGLHPEASIVLVSASPLVKCVSDVTAYSKNVALFKVAEQSATELGARIHNLTILQDRVTHVDSCNKILLTSKRKNVQYSRLCIATGAAPRPPPPAPAELQARILTIRDTDSVQRFRQALTDARCILVVGNGGIASEVVYATSEVRKIWVIRDDHITSTFIDPGAAQFFIDTFTADSKIEKNSKPNISRRHLFEEGDGSSYGRGAALGPDWCRAFGAVKGVSESNLEIIYNSEVKNIDHSDCSDGLLKVLLDDGRSVYCDYMIWATGVSPVFNFVWETEPLKADDGGLAVNEMQETSVDGIYAAGDAATATWPHAQHWFQQRLWSQARSMGAMAAKAMHGSVIGEPVLQDFGFELYTHCTHLWGFRVVLLGLWRAQGLPPKECELLLRVTAGKEYIKLVLHNGRMAGALLIGETDLEEMCENLILDQIDLSPFGSDILDPDIDIDDYFD